MKILLIYHNGFMANFLDIANELALAGEPNHEVILIVPSKVKVNSVYDPSGWLTCAQETTAGKVRIIPIPLKNPSHYSSGFKNKNFLQIIRQIQPDIIQVMDEVKSGYLAQTVWMSRLVSPKSKIFFYAFQNFPFAIGRKEWLWWQWIWSQIAGGATANQEALEQLKQHPYPKKWVLKHVFWGISNLTFVPISKAEIRKKLNFENHPLVGFVGRILEEKGIYTLLAAMKNLDSKVHCLMIGDGPIRTQLELLANVPDLKGRVHFLASMSPERLVEYMNGLDVLVLPSKTTPKIRFKEQYGKVLAEAMACGVPVIGSSSGAIPEVIGPAGLIFPEDNFEILRNCLQTMLFDTVQRNDFIERGKERARTQLSAKAMAKGLLSLYQPH